MGGTLRGWWQCFRIPTIKKVTWNSGNKVKFRKITLIEVNFKIKYVQDILTLEGEDLLLLLLFSSQLTKNICHCHCA